MYASVLCQTGHWRLQALYVKPPESFLSRDTQIHERETAALSAETSGVRRSDFARLRSFDASASQAGFVETASARRAFGLPVRRAT
jgi:hypothetical protein